MNGISIVVPTFNGASTIKDCLLYLSKQQISDEIGLEIVLVDNNSTDNTAQIVYQVWQEFGNIFPLRIVSEEQQGLSHARRKGVEHARFDLIIFCDDDNLLAEDYCKNVFNFFSANPQYALVGGEVLPSETLSLPEWFNVHHGMFAINYLNVDFKDCTTTGTVGAGMSIRTQVARKIFDSDYPIICIGPSGTNEFRCDDGEICRRVEILGHKMAQTKELRLWHHIEESRLNLSYLEKLREQGAKDWFILAKYQRALEVIRMGWPHKIFNAVFSFLKLLTYPLTNKRVVKEHNMDYLFFITRLKFFSDPYSRQVWAFTRAHYAR